MIIKSWVTPKAKSGQNSEIDGKGIFAVTPIKKGEILTVKSGHIIDRVTLRANENVIRNSEMQITDDLYIAPLSDEEFEQSMVYFNHSCEPNSGIAGNNMTFATRDIESGEEITIDYATFVSDPDFSMPCTCLSRNCRKIITGNDWQDSEVQKNNKGCFSWYIAEKIKKQS